MEFKALLQEDPKALHTCESTRKKVKDKNILKLPFMFTNNIYLKISYLENRTCDREKSEFNINRGPTLSCFKLRLYENGLS